MLMLMMLMMLMEMIGCWGVYFTPATVKGLSNLLLHDDSKCKSIDTNAPSECTQQVQVLALEYVRAIAASLVVSSAVHCKNPKVRRGRSLVVV
jgi:hypothetical protein